MYEKSYPNKRFKYTINFLKSHVPQGASILDLGVENPFSKIMEAEGYTVENTKGEDLDLDLSSIEKTRTFSITFYGFECN